MSNLKKEFYNYGFIVVVFLVTWFWFRFIWQNVSTDIQIHASFVRGIQEGIRNYPANFLYYYIVNAFSGFNADRLEFATTMTLSLAVVFKFVVTREIITEEKLKDRILITNLLTFALLFVMALPSLFYISSLYLYIGTFSPNVWHNSTTILVVPFSILLFWLSNKQLEQTNIPRSILITILILINILIKPSFLFVYIFAYPVMLLYKVRKPKQFWINLIPILIGLLLIGIEYIIIYGDKYNPSESSIAIRPFYLMQHWLKTDNLFYTIFVLITSLITSYLFPIVYLIRNPDERKITSVEYSLLCVILAIIIRLSFVETGPREFNGNFAWQVIICSFILFIVLASRFLKKIIEDNWDFRKYRYESVVFSLHVLFGIVYVLKIAVLKTIV